MITLSILADLGPLIGSELRPFYLRAVRALYTYLIIF
jgi:hypothetical protein